MPICEPPPRLLPARAFPSYAYLPGKLPHPTRNPLGHSYSSVSSAPLGAAPLDPKAFIWGMDLFNYGYYWEAHEAWEPLWRSAERSSADRTLLKGLILMAATGVKLRERKGIAAKRHGSRAAALFREVVARPPSTMERTLGVALETIAEHAEEPGSSMTEAGPDASDNARVFSLRLGGMTQPPTWPHASSAPP